MSQNQVDLVNLFQSVTNALVENQSSLDSADELNQNHGTNMVQTFQTVTRTVQQQKKKGASDSASLAAAARQLAKTSTSGSGQQYARNLSEAATQFKGQKIDAQGAMQLLMTLIGGGQASSQASASPAGGDIMSMLLGGLTGAEQPSQQQSAGGGADIMSTLLGGLTGGDQSQQQSAGGGADIMSTLLGGLTGGGQAQQSAGGAGGDILSSLLGGVLGGGTAQSGQTSHGDGQIGLDDILQAAGAFMQAKQSGQSSGQALIQAFMAASRMGDTVHRQQSTETVVSSFLQALGSNK